MTPIEVIATSVLTGLMIYLIQKVDNLSDKLDRRLDNVETRLTAIEAIAPKRRKGDRFNADPEPIYYSPNSGIEL
jgi:hypothetical protein